MNPRTLFIAGAHTEIGKTHAACGILRAALGAGLKVDALKPVVSGFDEKAWSESDPARLLQAMGLQLSHRELERLSPWRFGAPIAPPSAAALERRSLEFDPVAEFCRTRLNASEADLVVVEGVGGIMSPIAGSSLSLDLLKALACPCVLVGGAYLGAVSHTLTALEVLRFNGCGPLALIVSEDVGPDAPSFDSTIAMICEHAGSTPVLPMARRDNDAWAESVTHLLHLLRKRSLR